MRGTDHRSRITRLLIRRALTELLRQKPLQSITVKELCEVAGINRGTFYKLFTQRFGMSPRQYREQGAAPVPAPETDADTAV